MTGSSASHVLVLCRALGRVTTDAAGAEIAVLPVKPQYATAPVGIVTLKNRTLAQLFLGAAREVAKLLAGARR